MKKIYFVSLGCARNLVDSEVMLALLYKEGFTLTQEIQKADYLIVNTCGFLQEARDEAIEVLDELFLEKKKKAKVIAAGCMVQRFSQELKEKFPHLHFLLGSGDVKHILKALSKDSGENISDQMSFLEERDTPRLLLTPPHFAYLKIAEGCKKRCSFCSIPLIKGDLKSKPQEQVIKEFQSLLSKKVFEIILIAQDLSDYGKDRKVFSENLPSLLRELLKIKQDFWLRLLYVYPDGITDELIDIMASDPRICSYIDMPIQHVNDEILQKMHRKIRKKQIISLIEKLREKIPNIAIRTSLIVGFPGETDEQFNELVSFVKEYQLDHVGIFCFSKEKSTKAADLKDHISEKIKQQRYEKLANTQLQVVEKINKKWLGKSLDAIIEAFHPESDVLAVARTQRQAPEVDNQVIINDISKIKSFGDKHKIKINQLAKQDLIGQII